MESRRRSPCPGTPTEATGTPVLSRLTQCEGFSRKWEKEEDQGRGVVLVVGQRGPVVVRDFSPKVSVCVDPRVAPRCEATHSDASSNRRDVDKWTHLFPYGGR